MSTPSARVVVTGIGLVSAAGSDIATLCATLRAGQACLQPISSFDTAGMTMTHAGEVADFDPAAILPPVRVRSLDRATQMALLAARQALAQAGSGKHALDLHKTGVAIGVSGAHQYQNMPVTADRKYSTSRRMSLYFSRSTPIFQADFLADSFYLCGPRFAFGSASLGGLLAVAHAADLLRNGHADAMLVGGAEILSMVNALGMDVLGLGASGPCAPFYASNGMSFGEGAAFLVLETLAEAQRREVQPLAEIISSGVSGDAYHEISNDPAGQGLVRAIDKALSNAGAEAGDIAWIRACGTGHKIQDVAERLAFEQVFTGVLPPVTSTEPYFGHVNGVSPLLGLVAGIAAQQEGIAPSLPIEAEVEVDRALPLMASGPIPHGDWLLSAVAFGGSNGALVVGPVQARSAYRAPTVSAAAIEIAGVGMVSGLGSDCQAFIAALREPAPAIRATCRINERRALTLAGLDLRRRERIIRWSLIAVAQALADAQLVSRGSARIGLLVGLCRGPMTSYERFCSQVLQGDFNASTGRSLLKTGRFSVASEVVHAFDLRGYSGTMCPGVNGGVQLLAHGTELLRANLDLDALVVLAADEWTERCEGFYQSLGLLGTSMHAYDPANCGVLGGEGAAAVVLTRSDGATPQKWGSVAATAFGADLGTVPDRLGGAYGAVLKDAVQRAGLTPDQVDFAIGQGCGVPSYDSRELAALSQLRGDIALSGVLGHTGMVESAGGLFGVIAAAAALRDGCLAPFAVGGLPQGDADFVVGTVRYGSYRHALLCGSSERGAHAALVLRGAGG